MGSRQLCVLAVAVLSLVSATSGLDPAEQAYQQQQPGTQPYHDHHATTVCIEIRPPGRSSAPTKVCGPVVHGGPPQPQIQPQAVSQQAKEAALGQNQMRQAQQEQSMMKAAGAPCDMPRSAGPAFDPRFQEMVMMQQGFRQAGPPLPPPAAAFEDPNQQQREMMRYAQISGPPMPPPMMMPPHLAPVIAPGMPIRPRAWFQQTRSSQSAEELDQAKASEGPAISVKDEEMKKRLQNLLEECEDKTRIIKEKEAQIQQLLSKIDKPKREADQAAIAQMTPNQTVKTQENKQ